MTILSDAGLCFQDDGRYLCWTDSNHASLVGGFFFSFLDSFLKETRIPRGKLPITSSEVLVKALF